MTFLICVFILLQKSRKISYRCWMLCASWNISYATTIIAIIMMIGVIWAYNWQCYWTATTIFRSQWTFQNIFLGSMVINKKSGLVYPCGLLFLLLDYIILRLAWGVCFLLKGDRAIQSPQNFKLSIWTYCKWDYFLVTEMKKLVKLFQVTFWKKTVLMAVFILENF